MRRWFCGGPRKINIGAHFGVARNFPGAWGEGIFSRMEGRKMMMKIISPKIYPKKWERDLTYLKSPCSNVVHLCFRHETRSEYGMEVRSTSPMCGVWCWKNVIPVLVEDIENRPHLRICKNCYRYYDDEFWKDKFAKRVDYLSLEHCLNTRRKVDHGLYA